MSGPTADVRASRTLAYWLRHEPGAGGLTLDEGGWASLQDVLEALRRSGVRIDREGLEQVVSANDKQRFEISPDGRIRARQGHSVAVSGDWPAAEPPAVLFHGTVARFLPGILKEGLRPMGRHHVHLSADMASAQEVGARRGQPVVLQVDAARLASAGAVFLRSSNGVWLIDHVPPQHLQVLRAPDR